MVNCGLSPLLGRATEFEYTSPVPRLLNSTRISAGLIMKCILTLQISTGFEGIDGDGSVEPLVIDAFHVGNKDLSDGRLTTAWRFGEPSGT